MRSPKGRPLGGPCSEWIAAGQPSFCGLSSLARAIGVDGEGPRADLPRPIILLAPGSKDDGTSTSIARSHGNLLSWKGGPSLFS